MSRQASCSFGRLRDNDQTEEYRSRFRIANAIRKFIRVSRVNLWIKMDLKKFVKQWDAIDLNQLPLTGVTV